MVQGWQSAPLALQEWSSAELSDTIAAGFAASSAETAPATESTGFAVAEVHVGSPADTFLALPGSGHGLVWVSYTHL